MRNKEVDELHKQLARKLVIRDINRLMAAFLNAHLEDDTAKGVQASRMLRDKLEEYEDIN